ncbi:hypothetical protein MRX96_047006 [Rhipicephalus microplus]
MYHVASSLVYRAFGVHTSDYIANDECEFTDKIDRSWTSGHYGISGIFPPSLMHGGKTLKKTRFFALPSQVNYDRGDRTSNTARFSVQPPLNRLLCEVDLWLRKLSTPAFE